MLMISLVYAMRWQTCDLLASLRDLLRNLEITECSTINLLQVLDLAYGVQDKV